MFDISILESQLSYPNLTSVLKFSLSRYRWLRFARIQFHQFQILIRVLIQDPLFVKYGLNHIVALIEAKKAALIVIAHDVDPIEPVVFLPLSVARWVFLMSL